MKAVIHTRYGPPEVLRLREVEKPVPRSGELLVRVKATSVTAADYRIRAFDIPSAVFWLPFRLSMGLFRPRNKIPGTDFSGIVESIGSGITGFSPGDAVFGCTGPGFGAYAEYLCVEESGAVVKKPQDLSWQEAASLPFGLFTAIYFLRHRAKIQAGQKILIYGASGAVGTASVQLASYYGATVTAVCSSGNVELAASLGADQVIDYTREDFRTDGAKYDMIFDTVGKLSFAGCMQTLNPEGLFLSAVFGVREMLQALMPFGNRGRKVIIGVAGSERKDLLVIAELAHSKNIRAVIDRTYEFDDIAEAHRYADTGRKRGNIAVLVAKSE